jgi:uncharacterized membrane protein YhaH (DUF805 family)
MGFVQAISSGFVKYFNFRDRSSRSEYWYWFLFNVIVSVVAAIVDSQLNGQIVSSIFQLATTIPTLAVGVRRLHDIDHSGWWILISLIPLIGAIILVVWFATKGDDGPNRFGSDPLAANSFTN